MEKKEKVCYQYSFIIRDNILRVNVSEGFSKKFIKKHNKQEYYMFFHPSTIVPFEFSEAGKLKNNVLYLWERDDKRAIEIFKKSLDEQISVFKEKIRKVESIREQADTITVRVRTKYGLEPNTGTENG